MTPSTPPALTAGAQLPEQSYRVTRADLVRYAGGPAPATFPIVMAFEAMHAFLEAEQLDLFRIVHGEQRFAYERPIVPGDVLTATLSVATLRQIGGADIIGTTSEIADSSGAVVCTGTATLVHRGPAS